MHLETNQRHFWKCFALRNSNPTGRSWFWQLVPKCYCLIIINPVWVNIAESPGLTLSPMDIFGKIPQKTSSAIFFKRSQWNILILSNLLVGSAKEFAALVSPMMYFFQPGLCSTTLCVLPGFLAWCLVMTNAVMATMIFPVCCDESKRLLFWSDQCRNWKSSVWNILWCLKNEFSF